MKMQKNSMKIERLSNFFRKLTVVEKVKKSIWGAHVEGSWIDEARRENLLKEKALIGSSIIKNKR